MNANTSGDIHPASIESRQLESTVLVPATSLPPSPPSLSPSLSPPSLFSSLGNCSETHIPIPIPFYDDDDDEAGAREGEEVVLDLEYTYEHENDVGIQEELGLLEIEEVENFGVKFMAGEGEEDAVVVVEQTTLTSRSRLRWAGPMVTKRELVYDLEEDESGRAQERSVLAGPDGNWNRGEDVVRVEGGRGEVSLSLDVEDLLRLGGSEWGRLLDFDVESQGRDENGWSMEASVRDVVADKVRHHALTNGWEPLLNLEFFTLEKGVEDAVHAMHRRRDREREKEKEGVVRAPVVITVTPPTPPKAGNVLVALEKGEEGEEEWTLTMEMSDLWREREEREREREEEEVSFSYSVSGSRISAHSLVAVSRIPHPGRVLYNLQARMLRQRRLLG
jgi:hypothetical protein